MASPYPAVNRAVINLANASQGAPDPEVVAAARGDLTKIKVVAAIARADLSPEHADQIAAALLTDQVQDWLDNALAAAPRTLDPETKAKVVRLLSGGGK